jgi:hypothetical protein
MRFRPLTVWLCAFAVALNALWLVMAHADPQAFGVGLCHEGGGVSLASLRTDSSNPLHHAHDKAGHCPCCSLHVDQLAMLPAALASPVLLRRRHTMADVRSAHHAGLSPRWARIARGPPAST